MARMQMKHNNILIPLKPIVGLLHNNHASIRNLHIQCNQWRCIRAGVNTPVAVNAVLGRTVIHWRGTFPPLHHVARRSARKKQPCCSYNLAKGGANLNHLVEFSVTEREGLAQSEGASGKLIDQTLGNVRRQVQGRVFMQPSRLLRLYLTGGCNEEECALCFLYIKKKKKKSSRKQSASRTADCTHALPILFTCFMITTPLKRLCMFI